MRGAVALLAAVLALAGLAGCGESGAEPGAPKGATLVLDFVPNAVHSGIYTGQSRGYYREAGIDLTVRPPGESSDAPKLLAAGRVDFALLDIHDLGIARERGIDLVGVLPIVQRPLAAILARRDGPVRRPRDLEGHRVGVTGLPSDEAVVDSEVEADGGDPAKASAPSPPWPRARPTPSPPSGTPRVSPSSAWASPCGSSRWTGSAPRPTPSWC
jgi:ABC-type nitrate/sulfonate/bicarbonate transport system substrate-binding protein